ncbi:hypothetical protein PVAND_014807 [Polypedilum vanderplanki]|uniref:Uncharacterized protein n=1 Tax=Polypedilum vanderplanki TaxID=319348 RepID=A0A9J6BAT2_POLVA|nr:hypothetical protein PVAND_014807 [Polypedilum vanderplanki]
MEKLKFLQKFIIKTLVLQIADELLELSIEELIDTSLLDEGIPEVKKFDEISTLEDIDSELDGIEDKISEDDKEDSLVLELSSLETEVSELGTAV